MDYSLYFSELATTQVGQSRVLTPDERPEDLMALMRGLCPQPGDQFADVYLVVLRHGKSIPSHTHPEWVVMYYPSGAETPVWVAELGDVYPKAGEIVLIPPNTEHAVPAHTGQEPRISIAMKVPVPA
jgi:quercetin dioxygenase-like cupin family protein